ncbi:MAG: phosphopyruvate hydratase, partial [Thermomicrobiales bacterium]
VPSGASTGSAEAHELRDGDPGRYGGLGCRLAVNHVEIEIGDAVQGRQLDTQHQLDALLSELDGTEGLSRLGANAVLSVSMAFARAVASERGVPLYQHFADLLGIGHQPTALPRPTVNLFSGGKHAGEQMELQDVLVVANGAGSIDEAMAMTYAVFQAAAELIRVRYGMRLLVADEGGLAPDFGSVEEALDLAVEAIGAAGLRPGDDVSLCIDVAASHFRVNGRYAIGGRMLDAAGMVALISRWVEEFPIVSVEDGLAEDDWANWPLLRESLAGNALTLGDDLLTTHPARIERAIREQAADALLLKVNQIGTVSEAERALRLAREAGWAVVVSARSGETEDDWLSDLAVGWGGEALKVGSITRSERLAKWNRLLAIERETGLAVTSWPGNRFSTG